MTNTLRVVQVFIASPGDVSDERERTRRAIEIVDRIVARPLGILLQPIGWEDVPAGKASRVQELINPYLDNALLFVGLLYKRYGTPNGVADSGTEEEYERATELWEEGGLRDVKIYFRGLSSQETEAPDDQLQRIIDFKKRIRDTDLYREFNDGNDLEAKLLEDLAQWIHTKHEQLTPEDVPGGPRPLSSDDLDVLARIVADDAVTSDSAEPPLLASLQKLEVHELVLKTAKGDWRPAPSTEGFLFAARQLLGSTRHSHVLLRSYYFSTMIEAHLGSLVQSRFHLELVPETLKVFKLLASLSPRVTDYLLFGDTKRYDVTFQHSHEVGQPSAAENIQKAYLTHQVLLRFAQDSDESRLVDTLRDEPIAGVLVSIEIAAAFENRRTFSATSVLPSIRAFVKQPTEAGQLVTADPLSLGRHASILVTLGAPELGLELFDAALCVVNIPDTAKAQLLNNRALALLKLDRRPQAIDSLRKAVELDPDLGEAGKNLARAEAEETESRGSPDA